MMQETENWFSQEVCKQQVGRTRISPVGRLYDTDSDHVGYKIANIYRRKLFSALFPWCRTHCRIHCRIHCRLITV
jgi:hypothetical protein